MKTYELAVPLSDESVRQLRTGDIVYLTGNIFTSRDMAHLKYKAILEEGGKLPKDFKGAAIFHAGPVAMQRDGKWDLQVIGPTTSIRMEPYAEMVGQMGVKAIVGKGGMAEDTQHAAQKYGYVYLQAAPGCGAKLAEGIKSIQDVTYLEMGMPEALWDLKAEKFGPLVVGMDTQGNSIYADLKAKAISKMNEIYKV
ncbi:MAG: FumA C-terminus/TtdB family hydratase beta subunit [Oscillospiraceae bacterium]|nr:FumA C-terminus/TtdB family hydratase beta subunit [Oscillospiraceae bacterium]